MWRGALAPPWFERSLGPLRLVGYSTWNADCPPFEGCAPTRKEAYVIWLSWEIAGQRGDARRLLSLPIER